MSSSKSPCRRFRLKQIAARLAIAFGTALSAQHVLAAVPVVTTQTPAHTATSVARNPTLSITFDIPVLSGAGSAYLHICKTTTGQCQDITAASGSGLGTATVTYSPAWLEDNAAYYVIVDANAFVDATVPADGFAGITAGNWSFTTGIDAAAPTISNTWPNNNESAASTTATLTIAFSEPVQPGSGNIVIKRTSDDAVIETIAVTDATKVWGWNSSNIAIKHAALAPNTQYYINIDAAAIRDTAGTPNPFAGIGDNSTWTFTTSADLTSPTLTGISGSATATSSTLAITATHDEGGSAIMMVVPAGTTPAPSTAQIWACGGGYTGTISRCVWQGMPTGTPQTITADSLQANTAYDLYLIAEDAAGNLSAVASVLNQSTSPAAAPGLVSFWPANGETNTSWAAPWLTFNFDTTVQAGTGNIAIKRSSDNVTVQTISITDTSKVNFGGNYIHVQLAALAAGTQYYVNVDSGAIKDLANNSWPGISDTTSWSFLTSLDSTAPALSAVGLSGTNQNGTTLSATSGETASGYWIAVPAGSTAPAPSQVPTCGAGYTAAPVAACGNSGKTGMSANTPYSFAVSGLVGDTSYDLYLVAKDSVSNLSALSGPWNFTTLTDTVPPAAIGLSPGNNGVDVSRTASLSVTFDEPVQIGSGNITIYPYPSGTAVETIPVTDAARVSVSGSKLWISHSVPLNVNTQYYVTIDAGAIKDMATTPNSFVGIANNSTWAFTTSADATSPTLSALSLSGTTAYATTASITTTEAGFGYLLVVPNGCTAPTAAQLKNPASYTACGTTTYASHDMPAGTSSFTISGLAQNTAYTLHMTGEDNNGNLGNVVSSSFTTLADATAPVLSSVSLSGTFQNGTTLAVTSSEAGDLFLFIVPGGSPSPTAAQLSDGTYSAATVIQNYSIAMPAGTASHNIGNLIGSTAYDLYLAARDMGGNFSALSGPLNFTTTNDTVPPVISWLSPGNNTTGYSRFFDLNIGFDEPIQVGSGNITIYPYPSGAAVETIPVTDTARVLVSGNGLSFTHSTPLAAGTQYYVTLDAGAVRDQAATPNSFAGFTTNSTWRFTTTTDVTAPTLTGTGVSAITETGASFSATGDENNSRLWWLATNAGCSAPASLQVMKSEGYAACPVASAGKLGSKMSAGAAVSGTLSGLAAGTAYDLYLVAEDNVGNLSAASLLSFTTASAYSAPAAPPPPPPATTTAPPPAVDPTIVITPVTDPGTIFENPQDTTATGGVAIIVTPPSTPLVIAPDAPIGAAIQINTTAPIPVVSGATTLIYQPVTAGTVLQTQAFAGQVGLQVVSGAATVAAPTTGSTIPVVATTQATAALVTKEANTQVTAGRDANQNIVVAVDQGSVDYTLTPAGATAPISFKVFDGETLNVASTGDSQTLRLGSFDQQGNRPGDYIAAIPQASNALQVPILAGTPSRFGEPLLDRISQETASQYGLTPIADRPLAQDRVTGVLTFPTEQGIFRLLPIGPISLIIAPQQRAVSVSDIAANLSAVISASMTFAVAPATAYQDLTNLLRELDPASSMEILGDGVIQVSLAGTQYAAIPDMAVTPGGSTGAGFETANGQLVLRDSAGNRQALHPAFADSEFLLATFRPQMPKVALRYAGNGEYQATLQPGSPPLTLVPDIQLGTPSPSNSQAAQPWWQDAAQGKLFIRYPNNISQGFGVR